MTTPADIREFLAEHLITCARDDIPVDKIRAYLNALDVPADAHHVELAAIAELITNAQITVTWEENPDAGATAHSGHQH